MSLSWSTRPETQTVTKFECSAADLSQSILARALPRQWCGRPGPAESGLQVEPRLGSRVQVSAESVAARRWGESQAPRPGPPLTATGFALMAEMAAAFLVNILNLPCRTRSQFIDLIILVILQRQNIPPSSEYRQAPARLGLSCSSTPQ